MSLIAVVVQVPPNLRLCSDRIPRCRSRPSCFPSHASRRPARPLGCGFGAWKIVDLPVRVRHGLSTPRGRMQKRVDDLDITENHRVPAQPGCSDVVSGERRDTGVLVATGHHRYSSRHIDEGNKFCVTYESLADTPDVDPLGRRGTFRLDLRYGECRRGRPERRSIR